MRHRLAATSGSTPRPSATRIGPLWTRSSALMTTTVCQQLLGSAAEMFRIGQGAIDAAQVYEITDAGL